VFDFASDCQSRFKLGPDVPDSHHHWAIEARPLAKYFVLADGGERRALQWQNHWSSLFAVGIGPNTHTKKKRA
jgi:hypothetical protein